MSDREKITTGANDRAIDEPLATSAPGISDDALRPGEDLPDAPSDEEIARVARQLGAPVPGA